MQWRKLFGAFVGAMTGLAAIAPTLLLSDGAAAQAIQLKATFEQLFDCERPFSVQNHPIRSEFTATLNPDKTASADLVMRGVIWSSTVHFDARLGVRSQAGPGGNTQLRVLPNNRLQGIWDLPNNRLILVIASTGRSCRASLNVALKPGRKEYTFYDGRITYYCSRHRVISSTCTGG